jgi:hypothetical protein
MSTITDLNLWTTANDRTWTPLRSAGTIINDNFDNLNADKLESSDIAWKQNILSEWAFVDWDKTKLDSIATSATANSSDAYLLDRANHTWTQASTTVGLGNVDNTSDVDKPVSTVQQVEINTKEDSFTKNTAFNKDFWTTAWTILEWDTVIWDVTLTWAETLTNKTIDYNDNTITNLPWGGGWWVATTSDYTAFAGITAWQAVYMRGDGQINLTIWNNQARIDWFIWFATNTVLATETVTVTTSWVNANQTWLTAWSIYYLSDTAWAISTTPWTITAKVWIADSATGILKDKVVWGSEIFDTYMSAVYNLTTTTSVITFNTENVDTGSNYNTWTYQFTAPSDWQYFICYNVVIDTLTDWDLIQFYIHENTTLKKLIQSTVWWTQLSFSMSAVFDLTASDTIEIRWRNTTASRWVIREWNQKSSFSWYKIS